MPACARPFGYVPRQTHECDAAVLVRRHLAEFLGRCEERAGPLPAFVKAELEGFAGCGDFELGFVRTCCRSCGDELRVPFSCKSRGCCPSCMGRRMAEGADGSLTFAPWKPLEHGPDIQAKQVQRQILRAWPLYTARRATLKQIAGPQK